MDEPITIETLIDYHFGTLAEEDRARLEQRLVEDEATLRQYLQLKRGLDGAATQEARVSADTRGRLRAAVAAAHGPSAGRRLRRLLRRPMPLYQTLAVAAVVGLVVGAVGLRTPGRERTFAPPAAAAGPAVDTARPQPFSLQIF
jgi:hypothetical protein